MTYRRRGGAGGTGGGTGKFILGFIMMCGGGYLLLQSIIVRSGFGWGISLYHFGSGITITSGMVFILFMFGIGLIFYNSRNYAGWLLTLGSLIALIFGVIANLQVTMRTMSAFDFIVILVLTVGGLGLFLSSLRDQ